MIKTVILLIIFIQFRFSPFPPTWMKAERASSVRKVQNMHAELRKSKICFDDLSRGIRQTHM